MELKLWKNFSKKKNSTKIPSADPDYTKDVNLKAQTSLESPTFILSDVDIDVNYAAFAGHYYFIDDIRLNNASIYEVSCTQDVLATYRSAILSSKQFVERSHSSFDPMIYDNAVSQTEEIVSQVSATTAIFGASLGTCNIVRIAGNYGVLTYAMSDAVLSTVLHWGYNDESGSPISEALSGAFGTLVRCVFNPFQYIVSIKIVPFSISQITGTPASVVPFGYWSCTGLTSSECKLLYLPTKQVTAEVTLPAKHYADFRGIAASWTKYNIYLPGVGTFPMDPAVINEGITVWYDIDLITGAFVCKLSYTDGGLISSYHGNMAVDIQISQTNTDYPGLATSIGDTVSGGGVESALEVISKVIQPTPSVLGSQGALTILDNHDIIVTEYCVGSKDFPKDVMGQPLMKNVTLSTLSGFCKCGNPSIDITGLGNDKDAVNAFLSNGFYIE